MERHKFDLCEFCNETDDASLNEVEHVLRKFDYNAQNALADIVAGICDVDVSVLLSHGETTHDTHSRFLFWYVLRYINNESYIRIGERASSDGFGFKPDGIRKGVERMDKLIKTDSSWRRRWNAIKRIVKDGNCDNKKQ